MAPDAISPGSPSQALADLHLSLDGHEASEASTPATVNGIKAAVNGRHTNSSEDGLDPIRKLQQELERTREERDEFAAQYKNLLGKLQTMRNTLGNKLKQDAVRTPGSLPDIQTHVSPQEELDRREQQIAHLTAQNEDLLSTVEALQAEALSSNAEAERATRELDALRQEASGESLQREQTLREARAELERTRTARDDWEAEAMAQRVRAEEARVGLDATYRELAVVKEASERVSVARDAEFERANNLQAVLEDFQSGTSRVSMSYRHADARFASPLSLSAKDHELRQAVSEREAQLIDISQSLAEYKHRALQAEVCFLCDMPSGKVSLTHNNSSNWKRIRPRARRHRR